MAIRESGVRLVIGLSAHAIEVATSAADPMKMDPALNIFDLPVPIHETAARTRSNRSDSPSPPAAGIPPLPAPCRHKQVGEVSACFPMPAAERFNDGPASSGP